MSIVIIGGHDRMAGRYRDVCKEYKCKAKVFTQMAANLKNQIGNPDVIVLFTNTVSHKMIKTAVAEAEKNNVQIVRCHTSSQSALQDILEKVCAE